MVAILAWTMPSQAVYEPTYNNTKTKYFKSAPATPSLNQLISQWKALPQPSVTKALALVPEHMRMNYVLMRRSGSIQEATPMSPRVLLFSPTADLVISFNGHSGQVGGDRIEAIAYNRHTEMYDLVQVHFDGGKVREETNPRKCLACHTDQRIPNWGNYPIWEGMFGAISNEFVKVPAYVWHDRVDLGPGLYTKEGFLFESVSARDQFQEFTHFLSTNQKQNPRFSLLIQPANEPYWPLSPTLPAMQITNFDYQPGRRLGIGLGFHQARSIFHRLKKSALNRDYPASLTAMLLDCEKGTYDEFAQKLSSLLGRRPIFDVQSTPMNQNGGTYIRASTRIGLLSLTGVFPEVWQTVFIDRSNDVNPESHGLSFIGGFEMTSSDLKVGVLLLEDLIKTQPQLKIRPDGPSQTMANAMQIPLEFAQQLHQVIPLYSKKTLNQACVQLRPLIQAEIRRNLPFIYELTTNQWKEVEAAQQGRPYVLKHCAECHTHRSYPTAPFIPFGSKAKLRTALLESNARLLGELRSRIRPDAAEDIRMPHGPAALSPYHYKKLTEYIDELVK